MPRSWFRLLAPSSRIRIMCRAACSRRAMHGGLPVPPALGFATGGLRSVDYPSLRAKGGEATQRWTEIAALFTHAGIGSNGEPRVMRLRSDLRWGRPVL